MSGATHRNACGILFVYMKEQNKKSLIKSEEADTDNACRAVKLRESSKQIAITPKKQTRITTVDT